MQAIDIMDAGNASNGTLLREETFKGDKLRQFGDSLEEKEDESAVNALYNKLYTQDD